MFVKNIYFPAVASAFGGKELNLSENAHKGSYRYTRHAVHAGQQSGSGLTPKPGVGVAL